MFSFSNALPITTEVAQNDKNQYSDSGIRPQHADSKGPHPQPSQYAPGAIMLQRLSDDAEFHRLVDTLYEAVLEPAQMPIALALLSVYAGAPRRATACRPAGASSARMPAAARISARTPDCTRPLRRRLPPQRLSRSSIRPTCR